MRNLADMKFTHPDIGKEMTLKQFFLHMAREVWTWEECFSGKRPFGNSGWKYDVYAEMVRQEWIDGVIDEDGCVDRCDEKKADQLIDLFIFGIES